jgi:hypothetical protein
MKRRDLIRRIAQEAMRQGVEWKVHREGANHTIYLLGGTRIPIPRHTEIGERLALAIFVEAEGELGRRWWS